VLTNASTCAVGMRLSSKMGAVWAMSMGVGSVGAGGVRTGGGVVGRKSLGLGTGPINSSLSFAQSNCRGSCGVASNAMWAVCGGGLPCTLRWLSSIPFCSAASACLRSASRSPLSSCSSTPLSFSSLCTPFSLLSCCLIVAMVLFESVVVVVS
jgi:hypothetical protein